MPRLIVLASVFAICGAVCRSMFLLVETRWQIIVFILIAATFEGIASMSGGSRGGRFALNAIASSIAIISMKWHIEGFGLS